MTLERTATVAEAAHIMTARGYSQIPVVADGRLVGSVNEGRLFAEIVRQPELLKGPVEAIMEPALPSPTSPPISRPWPG